MVYFDSLHGTLYIFHITSAAGFAKATATKFCRFVHKERIRFLWIQLAVLFPPFMTYGVLLARNIERQALKRGTVVLRCYVFCFIGIEVSSTLAELN